jgi:hypothetical protein
MGRTEVLGAGLQRGRVNGEASNSAVEQAAARMRSLAAAHRGVMLSAIISLSNIAPGPISHLWNAPLPGGVRRRILGRRMTRA